MTDAQTLAESTPEYDSVDQIVKRNDCKSSALIPILQEIESVYNYLPSWALRRVSEKLGAPLIQVYGVASFYDAFHLMPRGKHLVRVCLGTACHVRGGRMVFDEFERKLKIKSGETTKDKQFTLERVNCVGCCALGPMVLVDDKYSGQMSPAKVGPLIKNYQRNRP
jgi:NADH-quinone oxidoreductase subunit E